MSTTGSCIHRGCTLAPFHIGPCIIPRSIAANCTAAIPLPQAEGPATKEPEQSPSLPPGSPSGVVEAAMKVFGDFTYEALRHHKERSTKVKEFHAATNLIWDALRSLPQSPATPGPSEDVATCLGCGKVGVMVRVVPGIGPDAEADEECAECGSGEVLDTPEDAIRALTDRVQFMDGAAGDMCLEFDAMGYAPHPLEEAGGLPERVKWVKAKVESLEAANLELRGRLVTAEKGWAEAVAQLRQASPTPAEAQALEGEAQQVSAENIDWVEAVVVSYNEGRLRLRDVIYKSIAYGRLEWSMRRPPESPKASPAPEGGAA